MTGISIRKAKALDVGLCSAPYCDTAVTPTGRIQKSAEVYVLRINHQEIRVCPKHLRALRNALKRHVEDR